MSKVTVLILRRPTSSCPTLDHGSWLMNQTARIWSISSYITRPSHCGLLAFFCNHSCLIRHLNYLTSWVWPQLIEPLPMPSSVSTSTTALPQAKSPRRDGSPICSLPTCLTEATRALLTGHWYHECQSECVGHLRQTWPCPRQIQQVAVSSWLHIPTCRCLRFRDEPKSLYTIVNYLIYNASGLLISARSSFTPISTCTVTAT